MFESRMHFIHLNFNSLLAKNEEMWHLVDLTNTSVIGISETKPDDSVLNSEIVIESFGLISLDRSRKGNCIAFFIEHCFLQI